MRLAVLGMGKMGHALAGRLLGDGHEVTVWNRTPGKADDLVEAGARQAASAAEAGEKAEVVITVLTDDSAVLTVMAGKDGVAGRLGRESVLIDMSTVSPATSAELAETSKAPFLSGPILGAPAAVSSGKAVYLVSGPKTAFETVAPVYESLSEDVRFLGEDPQLAPKMKLLANTLLLAGVAVLAEVVSAADAVGLSEETVRDFLASSPLVAPGLANRLEALLTRDHRGWFTTALGSKDLRLAEDMAKRERLTLPILELLAGRYQEAAASGLSESDVTAIVELTRAVPPQ